MTSGSVTIKTCEKCGRITYLREDGVEMVRVYHSIDEGTYWFDERHDASCGKIKLVSLRKESNEQKK